MAAEQIPTIETVVQSFLTDLASVRSNAVFTGIFIQAVEGITGQQYKEFTDARRDPENPTFLTGLNLAEYKHFLRLQSEHKRAQRGKHIATRGYMVSLVSQYDAFLSGLVRALFTLQPSLFNGSKRSMEVHEILNFTSIDELKDSIVDDEIESLLRESHIQQFAWLENKFGLQTLRKDLEIWPAFVEITQRRNLFVHSDGRVSKQYLKNCQEQGVSKLDGLAIGAQLEADISYVRRSADVFYEIAVKLSQVLWRKVQPRQIEQADLLLNEIAYTLLERKRYKLAVQILDFAFLTLKRHSNNEAKLRLLINRANAYRLSGNNQKCLDLISSEDWSATSLQFKLASTLLRGDIDRAVELMREMGANGEITKDSYRVWPLFEGARDDERFQKAFAEIFEEDLGAPPTTKEISEGQLEPQQKAPGLTGAFLLEFLDATDLDVADEFNITVKTNLEAALEAGSKSGVKSAAKLN